MNTYMIDRNEKGLVTLNLGGASGDVVASWTPYQLDSLAYNCRITSRDDMDGLAEHVRDNGTVDDADVVLIGCYYTEAEYS